MVDDPVLKSEIDRQSSGYFDRMTIANEWRKLPFLHRSESSITEKRFAAHNLRAFHITFRIYQDANHHFPLDFLHFRTSGKHRFDVVNDGQLLRIRQTTRGRISRWLRLRGGKRAEED